MRFGIVHHSMGHGVPIEQAMRTAAECGAYVLATGVNLENRDRIGELAAEHRLEIATGWGDRYIENGPNQPTGRFETMCRDVWEPLGIRIVGTASTHHRWRKDPPLAEQLERLSAALRVLAPVAADYGVHIAIENHADYRARDLIEVLERVDHPALRVQLDTGNPFAVAEEPVDAARLLAPYAVSTHIKDMTIRPLTDGEWVKVLGCTLGEGDVDLVQIAHLLAEKAPESCPFMIEVEPPPGTDMSIAFPRSVEYVRTALADVVEFRERSGA